MKTKLLTGALAAILTTWTYTIANHYAPVWLRLCLDITFAIVIFALTVFICSALTED